ncbi:MAG: SCO family protein [Rhodobiaceae bacterium]
MGKSQKTAFALAAAGLLVILALLVTDIMRREATSPAAAPSRPDIGGAFSLVDMNGQNVTQAQYAGKNLLIYFGFTYCPDVCPMALMHMGGALDILAESAPQRAASVQPLFITVDPERDTPEALAEYMINFHPRLVGLTGSPKQIRDTLAVYRVYASKVMDEGASDYLMDHSSIIYLMDGENRYLAHFDHNLPAQELAARLQQKLP